MCVYVRSYVCIICVCVCVSVRVWVSEFVYVYVLCVCIHLTCKCAFNYLPLLCLHLIRTQRCPAELHCVLELYLHLGSEVLN